jgi:hypothetical protein
LYNNSEIGKKNPIQSIGDKTVDLNKNLFTWNIGDAENPKNIKINFGDIKDLCTTQIHFVDLLIHYAFSLVNECTYPQQNKSKTCDKHVIDGINEKIARMIKTLQESFVKPNGSSK